MTERAVFVVASNPEPDSKLPYLLRLPLEGGLVLKARETWPAVARVYCHPFEGRWPKEADVLDEVPVASCRRRGAARERYPYRFASQGAETITMVFADTRRFAEDWAHRFLPSARADTESSER